MPAVKYVPILTLTQFDGSNVSELPLANYLDAYGPGSGKTEVKDGVLTISWPGFDGSWPVIVNTGDWLDQNGTIIPDAQVKSGYVPLSQLGSLL